MNVSVETRDLEKHATTDVFSLIVHRERPQTTYRNGSSAGGSRPTHVFVGGCGAGILSLEKIEQLVSSALTEDGYDNVQTHVSRTAEDVQENWNSRRRSIADMMDEESSQG
jgi:hypothetical protein